MNKVILISGGAGDIAQDWSVSTLGLVSYANEMHNLKESHLK